jgi:hypothetical protein
MDIPIDPDTGQPVEPFRSAVDRLWMVPPPDPDDPHPPKVEFGEFEVSPEDGPDLGGQNPFQVNGIEHRPDRLPQN